MFKKLFIIFLIAIVLFYAGFFMSGAIWITYTSTKHDLTLKYPINWKIVETSNNISIFSPEKRGFIPCMPYDVITININQLEHAQHKDLQYYEDCWMKNIKKKKYDSKIIGQGRTQISGSDAFYIMYLSTYDRGDEPLVTKNLLYIFINNDIEYEISYYTIADLVGYFKATNNIVKSIKIVKKGD